ncbi:serine carboxypeptidase-like 46 isoform X2 [Camellia sinensis]|uniref:serine carboxypeptidase-like 46 isoform X2 n=1 Tax=Camellia sinensis TaxID=4442 RepID=UPI001036D079|nr:serine carboxypeptidase-like 46 isoform X2 [Camellia sinensis]XP_028101324.1 serine carboxypeptidase-like 46 isoform X2 [Camellia sinensis]
MEVVESSSSSSLSTSDRIHQLPGQTQVSYQQFSGYVTVDAKNRKLRFLKLNQIRLPSLLLSGLGCSSLGVGAFSENGSFRPSGKALVRNEYSWNRVSCRHHRSCRMRMFPVILSLTRPSLAIGLLSAFYFYY